MASDYISEEAANKNDQAVAIVPKASNFDELLHFRIAKVSKKAQELGIKEGMLGKDALKLLNGGI